MSGTQTLRHLVRLDVAKELTFTGRVVSGEEAVAIGLATRTAADPYAAAMEMARELAAASPEAVRQTKRAIHRAYDAMGLRQALREALEIDIEIEADENPARAEFNRIRASEGLAAAIAWRDARTS